MNLSSKSVNICVENTAVTMLIPEFFKTLTIKLDPEDVTPLKTKAAITEETDEHTIVINIITTIVLMLFIFLSLIKMPVSKPKII